LRLARVVTDQYSKSTHPLKLWAELRDIEWLRNISQRRETEESDGESMDAQSPRDTYSETSLAGIPSSSFTPKIAASDNVIEETGMLAVKPKLYVDTRTAIK